ncbi:MAG: hypothetical protein ABEI98_02065 [Halorhabdus sp.]
MTTGPREENDIDPDAVARRLRARADRYERQQLALASDKFDDRDALESVSRRIRHRLLAGPLTALEIASKDDDTELARIVATLFDIAVDDDASGSASSTARVEDSESRCGRRDDHELFMTRPLER